jgi:hypothetical protein
LGGSKNEQLIDKYKCNPIPISKTPFQKAPLLKGGWGDLKMSNLSTNINATQFLSPKFKKPPFTGGKYKVLVERGKSNF